MNTRAILSNLRNQASHAGWAMALLTLPVTLVNRVMTLRRLDVVALPPGAAKPLQSKHLPRLSSRLATREDLVRFSSAPQWGVGADLLQEFDEGSSCLISLVDQREAGYTWFKGKGSAHIEPGLSVTIPLGYLYNFAALTLDEYRGLGLQPYRHHELLTLCRTQAPQGLLGYVDWLNTSSKQGQAKSGYQRIGSIYLIGSRKHYAVWLSRSLRALGMRRTT